MKKWEKNYKLFNALNNPFLHRIVDYLFENQLPLENTQLILPGKRPVVFIEEIFQNKSYNGFLPEFYSIEQLTQKISGLLPISGIPLWIKAFEVYKKIDLNESFENFLKWAPTVLKDFNELDIYTQNPKRLLDYMVEVDRIENWGVEDYSASELLQKNQLFWEKLKPFYLQLHQTLLEENSGTSGMIFRKAAENSPHYLQKQPNTHFVFAGFNALSTAERKIFQDFAKSSNTHFLWDIDAYYYNDNVQEAGTFFREYATQYPEFHVDEKIVHDFENPKNIQTYSCPKQVIQAKFLSRYLNEVPAEELNDTALVLCDENALNTVLGSIPEKIKDINITMGYPLQRNEIVLFFERIIQLHIKSQGKEEVYIKDLMEVMRSYVPLQFSEEKEKNAFEKNVQERKLLYVNVNQSEPLRNLSIFPLLQNSLEVSEFIQNAQEYCEKRSKNVHESIIQKAIYQKLQILFKELASFLTIEYISWEALPLLFRQLVKNTQLDFIGKPLEGLQIMGLLETRLLNFKNIVMLNVNEGVIPLGRTENSFIPFDIKKKFGIDTFLENDSVYAYHFLRLLQSAKNIDLLYNEVSEGLQSGEKSRFIAQLELESNHSIESNSLKTASRIPLYEELQTIEKTPKIEEKLQEWVHGKISPSALNLYLYNPIQFFQRYVLGIRDIEAIDEGFDARIMGTIVHSVLEKLYAPFAENSDNRQIFNVENANGLLPKITSEMNAVLQSSGYPLEWFEKGNILLEKKLSERMIQNLIQSDIADLEAGNTIEIIELERNLSFEHEHSTLGKITFGGFIDRIDRFNGMYRVIDYKTGKIHALKTHNKHGLIPLTKDSTHIVQLALYAEFIFQNYATDKVLCGIYSLKKLKNGVHYLDINGENIITPENAMIIMRQIDELITEIMNDAVPFEYEPEAKAF